MKDSMVIYTAYIDKFVKLSDAQFGKLMRLLLQYQKDGTLPEIDDFTVSLAFDVARYDIDKNTQKYCDVIAKRREAGSKGGKASASKAKQKVANGSKAKQTIANQADNDNVNDNVSKDVKENTKRKKIPSREEVKEYIREKNLSVDGDQFFDYFEAGNWIDSKGQEVNPWKQKLLTWDKYGNGKPKKESFISGTLKDDIDNIESLMERRISL